MKEFLLFLLFSSSPFPPKEKEKERGLLDSLHATFHFSRRENEERKGIRKNSYFFPFSFQLLFLKVEEMTEKKRKMTLSLLSFFLRKKSKRNRREIFPPFLHSFFQIEMEEGGGKRERKNSRFLSSNFRFLG